MLFRSILAALAFFCLSLSASAQTLGFPPLTGRVVDQAALLGESDRAALDQALAALEAKTTDQLVVVTLKSLQGTTIEDYGYQLGRAWGIGQKGVNNGVLLIVAPNERKVRIEVGYGLEGTLTDALTKIIIEQAILPRFKAGDFPGGIKQGTASIITTLGGDAAGLQGDLQPDTTPVRSERQPDGSPLPFMIFALVVGGFVILCAVSRGGGLCRLVMELIFLSLLSGRGNGSRGDSGFSGGGGSFGGGGGSFGGGGSSGSW